MAEMAHIEHGSVYLVHSIVTLADRHRKRGRVLWGLQSLCSRAGMFVYELVAGGLLISLPRHLSLHNASAAPRDC